MYPHKVSKFTDFYTVVVVVGAKRDGTGQTFFIPGLEDKIEMKSHFTRNIITSVKFCDFAELYLSTNHSQTWQLNWVVLTDFFYSVHVKC